MLFPAVPCTLEGARSHVLCNFLRRLPLSYFNLIVKETISATYFIPDSVDILTLDLAINCLYLAKVEKN